MKFPKFSLNKKILIVFKEESSNLTERIFWILTTPAELPLFKFHTILLNLKFCLYCHSYVGRGMFELYSIG